MHQKSNKLDQSRIKIKENVSYWLMPEKSEVSETLQSIIAKLAEQFGLEKFTPHITVFSAPYTAGDSYQSIIQQAVKQTGPIELKIIDICQSDVFTKTFYLQFEFSPELEKLSSRLQQLSAESSFSLNPHLSLMYATCDQKSPEHLTGLQNTLGELLIGKQLLFNHLRAVVTSAQVSSQKHVAEWFTVAGVKL